MPVINAFFLSALEVIYSLLNLYIWVLIVGAVLSWLVAFDIVNRSNRFVSMIGNVCFRLTEPVLCHLRRIIPMIGGMDLAPLALIFIIWFIQSFIRHLVIG